MITKTLLAITLLFAFSYTQVSAETDLPDIMVMTTDVGTVTLTDYRNYTRANCKALLFRYGQCEPD